MASQRWFEARRWRPLTKAIFIAGFALGCAPRIASSVAFPSGASIALWPGAAPGSERLQLVETVVERSQDPALPDRALTGITSPKLIAFPAPKPNGAGLIIAPGGGYVREALDKEGTVVAKWMAERGVSSFVLQYRLPAEGHVSGRDVPLQDAQRAMRIVRQRAREFGIDPERLGFMGSSAGGHVAAMLAANFEVRVTAPVDALDELSARPNFVILLYPVISMERAIAHAGSSQALLGEQPDDATRAAYSADRLVSPLAPPTLLVLANDDRSVLPENALRFYEALRRQGVPAELHVFMQGGHGFGMRGTCGLPAAVWPAVAWSWMRSLRMVEGELPSPSASGAICSR